MTGATESGHDGKVAALVGDEPHQLVLAGFGRTSADEDAFLVGKRVGGVRDLLHFVALACSSHGSLAAENLFLRKQLAFYLERKVKPRRVDDATRITLVVLARCIDWRRSLTIVQPDTLVRWHRRGFRLFSRWKSRCRGRPRIPVHLQKLIATMALANRTWGEERIAAELLVKLGIVVSPRTVRRYMRRPVPLRPRSSSQQWRTFLRNHAGEILACDFFVTVTATFRLVYVFLVLDIGTRRILHWNVTEQPTANGLCNMRFSFSNLTTTVSSVVGQFEIPPR